MSNRVVVTICGEDYTFIAEESAAYMQKVGTYVSEKMEEVLGASKVGRTDAAVLTAVNIADDLFKVQTEVEQRRSQLKGCLEEAKKLQERMGELEEECAALKGKNERAAQLLSEARAELTEQQKIAEQMKTEASEQREAAEQAKAEAAEQREAAEQAKAEAAEHRESAEQARAEAVEQREVAEKAKAEAAEHREVAEQAKAEAVEQRGVAEQAKAEAAEQREVAEQA